MRGRKAEKESVKDLFYRVLATLYRYSENLAVIEHPRSFERRSIDLAVKLRDGKRVLVKVAVDLDHIPRSELQELSSLSALLDAAPLIIAEMKAGEPLIEGVVYEKSGIKAVSVETLDNVLSGREPVFIRVEKSSFILSIDSEVFRRRRTEKNLSLGDLASMLGVSRRTIYEYEKGTMEPSIEKAEILIRVLGEDIARPIDIFEPSRTARARRDRFDTVTEKMIAERLASMGYTVAHARRTTLDIAARRDDREMAIVVEHPSRSSSLLDKVYYLNRLAETVDVPERYIVVETRTSERMLEKEGYEPIKADDFLDLVAGRDEGDIRNRPAGEREDNPREGDG